MLDPNIDLKCPSNGRKEKTRAQLESLLVTLKYILIIFITVYATVNMLNVSFSNDICIFQIGLKGKFC